MADNMYEPPRSRLIDEEKKLELVDSARWRRLLAAWVDGLAMMAVVVPVMFFTDGFSEIQNMQSVSVGYNLFIGLVSLVSFAALNGHFLVSAGQTLGKKVLGIRIVDMDGRLPDLKRNLVKRYALYLFGGYIPVIGGILSLVNILYIFGPQKRCLHDRFGETRVVMC